MMADGSDDPNDLVAYYRLLSAGYDCAFGSRFVRGGAAHDYPRVKLVVNRIVNLGIRLLFGHGYNDTTNAFKAYRRAVIDNIQPLLSHHFNLTVEIPLKAVVRGHSYAIVPISWRDRTTGQSKLRLQEMGSRYLFIVLYVFFEHHLSRGDYVRAGGEPVPQRRWRVGAPGAMAAAGRIHDAHRPGGRHMNYQRLYEYRFRDIPQTTRTAAWTEIAAHVYERARAVPSASSTPPPAAASSSTRCRRPSAGRWTRSPTRRARTTPA